MNKRFGKNDVIFISILALFCIAVCIIVYKGNTTMGNYIVVTVDGEIYGTYSLQEEQTICIETDYGKNIIEIKGEKAFMKEADCPDGLCIDQNEISFDKESIICLPNKVVVSVVSDTESELDGIIR